MLIKGTQIDNYVVDSTISSEGGMGDVYLVKNQNSFFALKIAKTYDFEYSHRFEREIRILNDLKGLDKIVQIIDSGTYNGQPYYVMPYYKNGSLENVVNSTRSDYKYAERVFIEMALCVKQLHDNNKYHRDIKPTNFLIADNNEIHLADFGLSIDLSQKSSFTATKDYLGTYLYSPPEYLRGDMHTATPQADIHMLGKSFYYLITGDNPVVIDNGKAPSGLRYLIEKSCNPDPAKRHVTIDNLITDLTNAFDIILYRGGSDAELINLIDSFNHVFATTSIYDQKTISQIGESFTGIPIELAQTFLDRLNIKFYWVIGNSGFANTAKIIWDIYKEVANIGNHGFEYAETIASNVSAFQSNCKNVKLLSASLEVGIISAIKQNRFAAMEKMQTILLNIDNDAYANEVVPIILEHSGRFLRSIEPEQCKSRIIYQSLKSISK